MRKIKTFLAAAIFVLAFSVAANAQGAVSYQFIEVSDSFGKPVADARVDSEGCFPPTQTTDEKGQLEKGFPVCYGDYQTKGMRISKSGYFTFEDLGAFAPPLRELGASYYEPDSSSGGKGGIRVELLKIPQTEAERKILGTEQHKRELFYAVIGGRTDEVKRLLKSGISPNLNTSDLRGIPGPKNVPAVSYAAALNNPEMIVAFLDAGADIKSKNSRARDILLQYLRTSPDPIAYPFLYRQKTEAERANPQLYYERGFDLLIRAGADINFTDRGGDSPLLIAARRNYAGIIKKLLALRVADKIKTKALIENLSGGAREKKSLETIELLLKNGVDPNSMIYDENNYDNKCLTPLIWAAQHGLTDSIKILLENKADVNLACKTGRTPLVAALDAGQPEAARMLLDARAHGGGASKRLNRTALMVAAERGYVGIVKTLLAKGLSVKDRDGMHETALVIAIQSKASNEVLKLLIKAGANPNGEMSPYCVVPLLYSTSNPNAIRLLIAHKADVNIKCGGYDTPIVLAARNGEAESVKILLEAGADIKGEQGQRALKYAKENLKSEYPLARSRAEAVIKILEAAGAK